MEENLEKKPRRPRIGESRGTEGVGEQFEKVNYSQEQGENVYSQHSYGNRQSFGYNRQGGYSNNRQGGYNNNRQGGYGNRQGGYNNNRQGGYNQRQGGYNRYNNYNNYDNNVAEGEQQGNNNYGNRQGGYRQGGYNNNRQGGYSNNRQNGYGNRQGGYNNNRQGGYGNRQVNKKFNKGGERIQQMRFTPRPKRVEYEMPVLDPEEAIRLNKFMANAGVCSRRAADELIQKGLVKVNGNVVTELGTKITHSDVVEYNDKVVVLESKCYILLNKPKDCVTTSDDPNGRKTVMDLVKGACDERIYPVGRLDRNTTGVLLLTNDGDLASKLTHPQYVKKKIYQVWVDKAISEEHMQQIADGIMLEDGEIHADAISYVSPTDRKQAGIEIHSGKNRIVRRIFESLGYHVVKLDRVYFAGLTKKDLPRGRWRYLTQEEVNFLKQGSFE
ncbi:MAG: pseudouridine synthase [Bacteroidales bacterium]|nr:pseudouridine synthase [Bacteroidales bacterium]